MDFRRVLPVVVILAMMVAIPAEPAKAEDPYRQIPLGLIPSEGDWAEYQPDLSAGIMSALPGRVDLSPYLPPVGNQGSQGSCVAWAVGYYYTTYHETVERGWDTSSPSRQLSPAYVYNQRDTSDCSNRNSGMSFWDAFNIVKDQGVAPLSMFPYNPSDACTQPSEQVRAAAYPYRAAAFEFVSFGDDVNLLKRILADGNPIAVALPIYESFYGVSSQNPVLRPPASGETYYGGHGMLMVGYDDAMGGFLAVNSWGSDWGLNGYLYLSYDFVRSNVWEAWVMTDHVETQSVKRVEGRVVVNGAPAAPGTPVSAVVDGQVLASTSTVMVDGAAHFAMDVPYSVGPQLDGSTPSTVVGFAVKGVPAQEQVDLASYEGDPLQLSVYVEPKADPTPRIYIAFVRR